MFDSKKYRYNLVTLLLKYDVRFRGLRVIRYYKNITVVSYSVVGGGRRAYRETSTNL